jgi:benzoyl-CoA reductase subunit C
MECSTVRTLESFRNLLLTRHDVAKRWKKQGKPVVGWTCTYTPEEVIYAANVLPVRVLGSLERTPLADAYLPQNVCSFCRSCFDQALRGKYDYLDGYVASNTCDNCGMMYDMWKYHVKVPYFYFINTPHTKSKKAHEFFYEEICRLKDSLERNLKTEIIKESLKNAVKVYNENRLLLKKAYDLRKNDPPLISGLEALEIVLSSMLTSKEEHNRLLERLLGQIENRNDMPKSGTRLLVSGSVMDNVEMIKIIEGTGANVVADDLCTGSRYFWDLVNPNTEPLHAIANRYLDKIPCPFTVHSGDRFKHTLETAKEYDVEGAIIFILKFCDTHLFDAPILVEELKKQGLPVLCLEWEHAMSGIAQLKTRIEAFVEMVSGVA